MTGLGASIYEQGREQGRVLTLVGLVRDGILQITEAARRAQMPEADFYKILEKSK